MTKPWLHIAFAPRDGRKVRVKCECGTVYEAQFREPCWWRFPDRSAQVADAVLYQGDLDLITAYQFQEL